MKIRRFDHNMGLHSILHLEAENIEEQQFFNKLWFRGADIVSYNGSEKLAITDSKANLLASEGTRK